MLHQRRESRRWSYKAVSAAAALVATTGIGTGVANAATSSGVVSPSYSRFFDAQGDPAGHGSLTVHGWGTLNWGAKYFYLTGAKVKDDAGDSHSVKMIIRVPGVGTKACYNSGGSGHIQSCHDAGKSTWTIGYVSGISGTPTVQLCVYNSTDNRCTKSTNI